MVATQYSTKLRERGGGQRGRTPTGATSPGCCGIGASPCFAGKYLYLMDNAGCVLVLEPGREYKLVAKNSLDHVMEAGWEEKHWNAQYHEVTLSTPVFEETRIYIRGEQFLYCIGEK